MVVNQFKKPKPQRVSSKKKQALKFSILFSPRVLDEDIISVPQLTKYLKSNIKVDNKLDNLGKDVGVDRDVNSVIVTANIPFSKRYLKYLLKKFLRKYRLRDFLRVVAKTKESYEFRFYNFETEDTDNEEES